MCECVCLRVCTHTGNICAVGKGRKIKFLDFAIKIMK